MVERLILFQFLNFCSLLEKKGLDGDVIEVFQSNRICIYGPKQGGPNGVRYRSSGRPEEN